MPNNAKTTWQCEACKKKQKNNLKTKPTTSTSFAACSSPADSSVLSDLSSDSDDDQIEITNETTGTVNKYGPLAKLQASDYDLINDLSGWLNGDIVKLAQVLIQDINPLLEGLQRPTLGRVRNFDVVSGNTEDQTNDLLGGDLVSLEFVPVQQQTNDSDCGVFAIAFAVSLALGTDPMRATFDVRRMRLHLAACLKDKKLNMFPIF
ncbi:hypothetical protein ACROYT_G016450 [Oculina patagonica]